MSISKSQASALAEGFLDHVGTDDKSSLQLKETFTELFLLAGEFVEDCQHNLNASNSNASGKLSESLILGEPTQQNSIVSVDLLMNFYGRFVNAGVKGTKSGKSTAGYSFKSAFPSRDMVKALQAGIGRAKRSTSNVRRSVSRNEVKNVSISAIDKAYGAGRNIKMYGIKPTGFLDKAVLTTEKKVSDRLESALVIDIINSI